MKRTLFSLCILLYTFSYVWAALNAPKNLEAVDVSDTSITLDWDDTSDAVGYYIYYGTQTASGGVYEEEGVDLIEESTFTLDSLIPETKYFIAVTAVDEFAGESEVSQELEYSTLKVGQKNQAGALRISDVKIIDATTLEFLFSLPINTQPTAPLEFRLEEIKTSDEIMIDIVEVDPTNSKNVIAVLNEWLKINTEYKVTVLDIEDTSGKTIASGIDAFLNFSTPTTFEKQEVLPTPSEDITQVVDLNSASPENIDTPESTNQEVKTPLVGNNAGVTVSNSSISQNVVQTAQENTNLPQTGPTQWFLIIIALLAGGVIYFINARKTIFQK